MRENINLLDTACLILVLSGAVLTARTLKESLQDRRALLRAGIDGLRRHLVHQSVRHDVLRLLKHLVLAGAIIEAILGIQGQSLNHGLARALRMRNLAVVIVSLIMALNSLLDLRGRRRALRELKLRRRRNDE